MCIFCFYVFYFNHPFVLSGFSFVVCFTVYLCVILHCFALLFYHGLSFFFNGFLFGFMRLWDEELTALTL